MQARILGSFQLEEGGRRIPLGGVRQRAVFVGLLLHANEVVPSEQLLMNLWGDDSPPGAANSLQAAISRLRRVLPQGRLITETSGYVLRIFPGELDVSQFEQLVSEGREALTAGDAGQAARTLRQALSLWQGPGAGRFPLRTVCPGRDRAPGGAAPDMPGRANRGGPGPRPGKCTCR